MQGFPIGGSKIRLSWGKSQSDKAAQAAAQAAQLGLNLGGLGTLNGLSVEHTAQLLQSIGISNSLQAQALASLQKPLVGSSSSERRGSGSSEGSQYEGESQMAKSVPMLSRNTEVVESQIKDDSGNGRGLKRAATLPPSAHHSHSEPRCHSFTYDSGFSSSHNPTAFGPWNSASYRPITPQDTLAPSGANPQDFFARTYNSGVYGGQITPLAEPYGGANLLGVGGPFSDFSSFKASDILRNIGSGVGRSLAEAQVGRGIAPSSSSSSVASSTFDPTQTPSTLASSASTSSHDQIMSSFKLLNLDEDEPLPKPSMSSSGIVVMRPALPRSLTAPRSFESMGMNISGRSNSVTGQESNDAGASNGMGNESMQVTSN
jgi:hypothetical protein